MRGERPFLFTNLREDVGLDKVIAWLEDKLNQPAEARRGLMDAHLPYAGRAHSHEHGHSHEHEHEHGHHH